MTDAKIKEIYGELFDVENVFERKSQDEVQHMLNVHFKGQIQSSSSSSTSVRHDTDDNFGDDDDISFEPAKLEESTSNTDDTSADDEDLQKKLEDLMSDL